MEQNFILFKFTDFYLISQNVHCHYKEAETFTGVRSR